MVVVVVASRVRGWATGPGELSWDRDRDCGGWIADGGAVEGDRVEGVVGGGGGGMAVAGIIVLVALGREREERGRIVWGEEQDLLCRGSTRLKWSGLCSAPAAD